MKHLGPISGVACYKDKWVATAGYDNQVILWSATDKKSVSRALHDHLANFCQFSPDGNKLFTTSSDYTARAYAVPSLQMVAFYGHHEDDVESLAVSPSGKYVATACRDHKVRVFEVGGKLLSTMEGHQADALSVAWNSDETRLLSSGDDGTIREWDWQNKKQVSVYSFDGVETDTIALTESGVVFCGNDIGQIIVIKNSKIVETIQAHSAGVKKIKVFQAGGNTFVVSSSYDRTVKLWRENDATLEIYKCSNFPAEVWPRTCDYLDSGQIIFGSFGSTYATWFYEKNQWSTDGVEGTPCVNAVAVSSSDVYSIGDSGLLLKNGTTQKSLGSLCNFLVDFNGTLLSGGQLGIVFDANTGAEIYTHKAPLNCAVTIPIMNLCLVGTYTGELLVFTKKENQVQFLKMIKAHPNAVKGVAFSDSHVMSVSADRSLTFIETTDLLGSGPVKISAHLKDAHEKIINGCVGLAEGVFASVSRDLNLSFWKFGTKIGSYKSPHNHSIKCVSRSEDSRYVAAGTYNGEVSIFDTVRKQFVKCLRPTAAGISCLTFADGRFWAASYNGKVYEIHA